MMAHKKYIYKVIIVCILFVLIKNYSYGEILNARIKIKSTDLYLGKILQGDKIKSTFTI